MLYLLGQLKGFALDQIKELPITDGNYEAALQIFKENFEDTELILQRLVYKLLDLSGPKYTYQDLQ